MGCKEQEVAIHRQLVDTCIHASHTQLVEPTLSVTMLDGVRKTTGNG